jgi:hypothetical protein
MGKKATAADAELILRLYELRREPEMRKARNWWLMEFWPKNVDDYLKALAGPENHWLRQVQSYWGIAAAFVLEGVLHEELFLKPSFSGEMFIMFVKIHPFLDELREKLEPKAFADTEKVILRTKWGRERLQFMLKRVEMMRERFAKADHKPAITGHEARSL